MKSLTRWHLLLLSGVVLATLSTRMPGPAHERASEVEASSTTVEHETGGFVLYQPMNDADGQATGTPFTQNGKVYPVTTVRWAAVGFLHVEKGDGDDTYLEHWYLSKGDANSTVTGSPVAFVAKYFWTGRSSPAGDKHVYWNDLPIRFLRRNDLSGAVDLAEFVSEVGSVYGFALAAEGNFVRYDHTTAKAAGY